MGQNSHANTCYRNSRTNILLRFACLFFIVVFSQSISAQAHSSPSATKSQGAQGFQLTSTAFEPDGAIPVKYACNGANVSPGLGWTEPPPGTQSFVLIVDDPDAAAATPVVHWLVYAIPAMQRGLQEGTLKKGTLPNAVKQGKNSAGKIGYSGPCPEPGKVHHYFFKLYALDYTPDLKGKEKIADVEAVIHDHVLGTAELIGRFQRE